jgi:hypothetical protein
MSRMIKPDNVEYVFDNPDGTSTVGVGYDIPDPKKKGEFIHQVENQIVTKRDGAQLAIVLKRRAAEIAKIQKAAGGQPPGHVMEQRLSPPPMVVNGRPITMEDVMKVRRKRGP